jgi:hypothetical protein
MKDPARRHPTVSRWRMLVLVAVAAAMLAGCDLATGTVRTATELQRAGIDNPNLNYDGGTATLHYDADPNALDARAEQDRAAAIIWRNLPFRIERIVITSDSGAFPTEREYTRDQLEQELGPRPANLDRSVGDIARRATVIAGVVALVVLVLIVLVIVLVVRAVRRRPPAQPAPAWPQGPPGSQSWGQQGPPGQQPWGGQPGYGQPPAPAWPEPQAPQQPPAPAWPEPQAPQQPQAPAPPPSAPPPRGPGDTQRLEPEPPPDDQRGPTPPVPPA